MYGPTTGDRVRLADTDLVIEVEHDHTIYGEEVKFGGGKVIRDGMGQSQRGGTRRRGHGDHQRRRSFDHWGIVKADIGIKDGRIAASARPATPTCSPASTSSIGPGTEIIAGEGCIADGGRDRHAHPLHLRRSRSTTR